MNIDILCSSLEHAIYPALDEWRTNGAKFHKISIVSDAKSLSGGDFLFLVSATEIIPSEILESYSHPLVIHGSDLPKGRGWSPITWQMINREENFTLTLLEADNPVDSGKIWKKIKLNLDDTLVFSEIMLEITRGTIELMDFALVNFDSVDPVAQFGVPTYHDKRSPIDSEIKPAQSISDVFDIVRVSDPNRYPAHFTFRGRKYRITIDPM